MAFEAKYDTIGLSYNTTRKADPYLLSRIETHLLCDQGQTILDIGCGSGNYTSALSDRGYIMTGVDPSQHMLNLAKSKSPDINWLPGTAENIPLGDHVFDAALGTLTLHHWESLIGGFNEVNRVLKPAGRFVIFTSTKSQMEHYWLRAYFPKMIQDSIDQMPGYTEIIQALKTAGFKIIGEEKYEIHDKLEDKFLYVGKNRPEVYLDKSIRNGISSFSSLAHKDEVESGLNKLEAHIESGKIQKKIEKYNAETGDYLFIIAEKI